MWLWNEGIKGLKRSWVFRGGSHKDPTYIRLRLDGIIYSVFPNRASRAWSQFNLACASRWGSIERRGVWTGVENVEGRGMAWIEILAWEKWVEERVTWIGLDSLRPRFGWWGTKKWRDSRWVKDLSAGQVDMMILIPPKARSTTWW